MSATSVKFSLNKARLCLFHCIQCDIKYNMFSSSLVKSSLFADIILPADRIQTKKKKKKNTKKIKLPTYPTNPKQASFLLGLSASISISSMWHSGDNPQS